MRKCENKSIPNTIVSITSTGHRLLVGDARESYFFVRYKMADNQLVIFADDTTPRWLTSAIPLDYSTVGGVDKFGNFNVSRLGEGVSDNIDEDPTGSKAIWDRSVLGGAPQKCDTVANYHIGNMALSLQKATLTPGGSECLVYTTISGGVGVFVPFTSKEDVDFFQHLEMHLRSENPPLCGRDHLVRASGQRGWLAFTAPLFSARSPRFVADWPRTDCVPLPTMCQQAYRSAYFPVKNVVDGDLCEQFNSLDATKKRAIAEDLDRTPAEVSKKLEDIRNRFRSISSGLLRSVPSQFSD